MMDGDLYKNGEYYPGISPPAEKFRLARARAAFLCRYEILGTRDYDVNLLAVSPGTR